jgi:putative DNA primase/helicase
VKALTGGDKVTARHLYAAPFEFVPQFSLWLATNHLPVVREQDHGLWRRVALVPFPVTIAPEDQDRYLERKLRAELPGILAWCVRGWQDFQERGGLAPPEAVELQVEAYKADQDTLAPFLESCTVTGPNARCTKAELYAAYKDWCDQNGERPQSQNALGRKLKERGLEDEKSTGGKRVWLGIALQSSLLDQ